MRFYTFVALAFITLFLDLSLLVFALLPSSFSFLAPPVLADARPTAGATPRARPTTPAATSAPTATIAPSSTALPSATATPTIQPTATPSPTATPVPAQLIAAKSVSFAPGDRAVKANIRLALAHYQGALAHVVLAPGDVFSFNATLGLRPQRLPWKDVVIKPTAIPTPADASAEQAQIVAAAQRIQGGGLCDLASRFVMAARPLLPSRAFRYVNHVRSNGIHLRGVPVRDSVSIWAIGGGPGEQDLKITNLSTGWLEFIVVQSGDKITVTAQLWDRLP